MITRNLLIAAAALSLIALPAMAQTKKADTETTGHHYNGGPKTVVPHHMSKKDTGVTTGKAAPRGSHHYSGGPRSDPHHIGPK